MESALSAGTTGILIGGIEMELKPWLPTDDRAAAEAAEIRQLQQAFKVTPDSKKVEIAAVNIPKNASPDQALKFTIRIKNKQLTPRIFKGVRQVNFWKESEIKDNIPRKGPTFFVFLRVLFFFFWREKSLVSARR